jgi:drug/metabolite transporter (DMT)-like permease
MLGSYIKLALAPILWGGALVAGRIVTADLPPLTITWVRYLLVSLFLLPALRFITGRLPRPNPRGWILLVLLSLTGVVGFSLFLFSGLQTVTAVRSSVLIALAPSVVAAALILFFREPAHWNLVAGIATAFFGAAITITDGEPGKALAGGVSMGDAYLLGCVACWTAYTILARPALRHIPALAVLTYSSIIGTILLTPFAVGGEIVSALATSSWTTRAGLFYLSVGATGLAYLLYYGGIRDLGPGKAAVFLNLEPISAILLGVLLLGEKLTWPVLAGAVLVITGLYLVNRPNRAAPGVSDAE